MLEICRLSICVFCLMLVTSMGLPSFAADQSYISHSDKAEQLLAAKKPHEAALELIEAFKLLPKSDAKESTPEARKVILTDLPAIMLSLAYHGHYQEAETLGKWAFSANEKRFGPSSPLTYMALSFLSNYCYCQVLNHMPDRKKLWESNNQKMESLMNTQSKEQQRQTQKMMMDELAKQPTAL